MWDTVFGTANVLAMVMWAGLILLPRWPAHRILDLAPVAWDQTLAAPETQALLAAKPYCTLTLREP